MSAIPQDFLNKTATLRPESVQPFPASRKVYVYGSRPDVRVPMREIAQSATPASTGPEHNPPLTIYDTTGPYTDPDQKSTR